ncbi:MAG: hypothetical protein MMC23_002090 [Stictis urceolatum]|nr:hypothetical protein [Stictis urceolata]
MEEAEDFVELGLEGFDKVVDNDFWGVHHKVAHAHPLDKAKAFSQKHPFHHHHNSNDQRNSSAPADNDDYGRDALPSYADPRLSSPRGQGRDRPSTRDRDRPQTRDRDRDRERDIPDHDSPRNAPRTAPYDGPRDPYDRSWYEGGELERRDTRGSARAARPRPQRRPSSASPAMRNERYANAGLDGYVAPSALAGAGLIRATGAGRDRGGYIDDSEDEEDDRDDRRRRRGARSVDRERRFGRDRGSERRRKSRGRYDDDDDDNGSKEGSRGGKYDRERGGKEPKRENINGPAWGAIAGGLVGSEVGKKSPIIGTFVGAGLGALGGKFLERRDRDRREGKERRERRWD